MKKLTMLLFSILILFLSGCTSPDGGFTKDDANDVRFMTKGMEIDRLYSNAGHNTNYGLLSVVAVMINEKQRARKYYLDSKKHISSDEGRGDILSIDRYGYSKWPNIKINIKRKNDIISKLKHHLKIMGFKFLKDKDDIVTFGRRQQNPSYNGWVNRIDGFILIRDDYGIKVIATAFTESKSLLGTAPYSSYTQRLLNKLKKDLEEDSTVVQISVAEKKLQKCNYPKWVVNLGLEGQYASENKCK